MEFFKAFLFGIVEGITEWLPISSTGHMILLNEFIRLDVSEEFYRVFEVLIQLGAVLAVIMTFFSKIFPFGIETVSHGRKIKKNILVKKSVLRLWVNIIISCIPAIIIGLPFSDLFEELFYNYVCVAIALIVFGIAFIILENRNKSLKPKIRKLDGITLKVALIIGIFQVIAAIFPGTSRSGATIIGALLIGVSRTVAAEYTFLLSIPVMAGASLLKLIKYGFNFTPEEYIILAIGTITAFIVSVFAIKFLLGFVKKHDFKIFGYYRIVLGVIVLLYFMILGMS